MVRATGVLCVLLLVSCSKKDPTPKTNLDVQFIQEYITTNGLTTSTTTEGVYRYPITQNPAGNDAGDVFSIYYTISDIRNDIQIASHQAGDGDPIKLQNNASAIFPLGLEYGIDGIKEGETYGLILPGNLGFGDYPTSAVADDAILLFEVEVILRENEADIAASQDTEINAYITANDLNNTTTNPVDPVEMLANGIYYKRTVVGNGTSPLAGDSITVNYAGRFLNDTEFDNLNNFKYKFNSGSVVSGFDIGVSEMELGERATIFIPSAQAYGSSAVVLPEAAFDDMIDQFVVPLYASKVPPYKVLIFDVTLQTIH